jgi:hypothetical protein
MPYLHWETDRQRETFAGNVERITEDWIKKENTAKKENKLARQRQREGLPRIQFQKPEEKISFCECTQHLDKIPLISLRVESTDSVRKQESSRPAINTNPPRTESEY